MEYLNKLTIEQINILNEAMHHGIDIRGICDYRYEPEKMKLLLKLKYEGYNIDTLLNPLLSLELLKIYATAMVEDVEIEGMVNSNFTKKQLRSLIQLKKEGYEFSKYPGVLDPEFTDDYLAFINKEHDLSATVRPKEIYKRSSIANIRDYITGFDKIAKQVKLVKKAKDKK